MFNASIRMTVVIGLAASIGKGGEKKERSAREQPRRRNRWRVAGE